MDQDLYTHPRKASPARQGLVRTLVTLGLVAVTAHAVADEPGAALTERIGLDGTRSYDSSSSSMTLRVTQSLGEPMATSGPASPQDAWRGDTIRQTMFWAEHGRSGLGVGFGIEQRGPINGPYSSQGMAPQQQQQQQQLSQPEQSAGMLLGLSLATSERSHLTIQTPLMNASRNAYLPDDPAARVDGQRQVRVGLVFNSKKPLADLRKGWRTELSGQSSVAVKLRGGRLGFAFQKSW